MSSGELPLEIYHRTNAIGSGSYGSVVVVYDDEGQEYAMKLFDEEDDDSDDGCNYGISLGTLREISILRLLRNGNSHPNVIEIHDIQTSFGEEDDEEVGIYAMAMPLYSDGSLADAFSKITTKKQKAVIAYGILNALAFLHENSIIHRDIKSDNIMLSFNPSDGDDGHGTFEPVLIDFSLAKFISADSSEFEPTHTSPIGTPTYRSPEVVDEKPYGLPSDLWSVGVVLLEMLQGKCIEAFKDKDAIESISHRLDSLPEGQPFPTLLRNLLEPDPLKRWTAREALNCDFFVKFHLSEEAKSKSFHLVSLSSALPIEGDEYNDDCNLEKENNRNQRESKQLSSQKKTNSVLSKRSKFILKVCDWMEWDNPFTAKASMLYITQMNEIIGNVDDLNASNAMLDCLVLAHKFFERNLCGTSDLDALYEKFGYSGFDTDEYLGNENTLFSMMDFCLYPRCFNSKSSYTQRGLQKKLIT
jgi:serine/threonine protein kinase